MACVGRTKICSIVPPNHFGPIPGVPVGSAWKFRVQVWLSIYSVVVFCTVFASLQIDSTVEQISS